MHLLTPDRGDPRDLRIPQIPGMNSTSQEKRVFYNAKLTLVIQEFTKIRLSPCLPKGGAGRARGGQRRCPWGLWGSLGHPCGPFCIPSDSPWGPFGSPWVHLGVSWKPFGTPQGGEASNYINKLPINRQSGRYVSHTSRLKLTLRLNASGLRGIKKRL